MTKQPEYFVIAGPNGAGKSTHGHLFVTPGLEIFNGDLEYAKLQKKYPLVEPIRLQGGVASLLENARNEALHQKKKFCF